MRPTWKLLVVTVGTIVVSAGSLQAQVLLGVLRVDNGGAALTSASATTYIDWFNVTPTSATLDVSIDVSALATFSNAGNATSEGHLTLSQDGRYLTFGGYNTAPGTLAVSGTTGAVVQRQVGLMDFTGTVTTTLLPTTIGGNPRSAVSTDGSNIWVATSAAGIQYTVFGSGTSTQLSTTPVNTRVANIFNSGQLYTSSGSSPFVGVSSVGTGEPTTSGQTTTLQVASTGTSPSPYDYVFVNPTTLVVADDRTSTVGGLEKFTFNGSSWALAYSALGGASSNVGMRGLTYDPNTSTFYATGSDGNLYSATDTGTTFTFDQLFLASTLGTNDQFRGLDFVPVPEPGSIALVGLAAVGFGGRLLRRKTVKA